jgi:signal transduction histidine kinase
MKPGIHSLKGRLFFWSLLITSSLLIILGFLLHFEIKKAILRSVEHTLHSKIQILKGLMHEEHGAIELELAEIVSGEYSVPRSGHYYKVLLQDDIFAASPSLIDDNFNFEVGELQSSNEQLNEKVYLSEGPANEPIMAVRHDFVILDQAATVYAAQSLEESIALINTFKHVLLIIIPASIGILTLTGLWISRKSMKPLENFSSTIEKITHTSMNERIPPELQVSEVKKIANSFNDMLDRLQSAFEMEKRLVADASHELKTPLSVINAQCDVLLQDNNTEGKYAHALNRIKAASTSMNRLTGDMLSLARLDSGSLSAADFTTVSLNECIDNALKFTEFSAKERKTKITKNIPEDINIRGMRDLLTEVFMNIIDNAIKYNRSGGIVKITAARNKNGAEVTVQDTGEGILKKDVDRIFDRFYRADTSRGREGTGLGLSIAKAIVETHGGRIKVKSEPGKGSCFTLTLPTV